MAHINFDLVMESDDYSVDMARGIETLQGASEITRFVAETILDEKVPKRLTNESDVKTRLKKSFKGSYGQIFTLEISDDKLSRKMNSMGKATFIEMMRYFVEEALYQNSLELSAKAKKVLTKLQRLNSLDEELIEQLRKSSLKHLHALSSSFNKDVKLRYRKLSTSQEVIAKFDQNTFARLQPVKDKNRVKIKASITRLNINTGNGRLLVKGEEETVSFGFNVDYKEVKIFAKAKFSENLDYNNRVSSDEWKTLELEATTLKLKNGKVVKYFVEVIHEN